MKGSIKIKSVGGATLGAGNFGDSTAGDFNFPIDCLGATDANYFGNAAIGIVVNSSSGPGDGVAALGNFSSYKFHLNGSTSPTLINKAFVDAILANNGSGESIVQLPEGVTITGWEISDIIY